MKPADRQAMRRIFEMQCNICKAMAHPLRLEIVEVLHGGEMSAAGLLKVLGTSKANLSKHMNQLTSAGITEVRRNGRNAYYHLTHPDIHEACAIMRSILYRQLKKGERLSSVLETSRRT
jgi:DNA-binding transcriptional ArsR family regulator